MFTKKEFEKLIKNIDRSNPAFILVIFFGYFFSPLKLIGKRYFIYLFHLLGWVNLRNKSSSTYSENELILIAIKNDRDKTSITQEVLFQWLGVSRNTFKKHYKENFELDGKLTFIKLARIFNKWTGNDWRRIEAFQKKDLHDLEGYYFKRFAEIANSKSIKELLKDIGGEELSYRDIKSLPPVIVKKIFDRDVDPDNITYHDFIEKLNE